MNFISSSCGAVAMFVILLITTYSGIAIGDNIVEELYTVKINGVPIRRDVAENVLLRVNSNYNREGINVCNNNAQKANIQLKKIEKDTDINIEGNMFLSDLSNLYKSGLKDNKEFKEKTRRIKIDKNNGGVVSYLVVFLDVS
jgi:hypothetical protein